MVNKILGILLLLVAICKVVEPAMYAWQFEVQTLAESVSIYNEQTREIKVYHPLPYHSNWDGNREISDVYREGDKFYNVIESRFSNDTFYIKVQDNLSAREQFFALGDAVQKMTMDSNNSRESNSPSKNIISFEDLLKGVVPALMPQICSESWLVSESSYRFYSNLSHFFDSPFLTILVPPPNC
jgi:hypothetical protein